MDESSPATEFDPHAAIALLNPLLGTWRGRGRGRYPGIESFAFLEELTFSCNGVQPLLHYVQRTWRLGDDDKAREPLHWESGFLRAVSPGVYEISNAQEGGRVEVLRGGFGRLRSIDNEADRGTPADGEHVGPLILSFESVVLAHDARMVRTKRIYEGGGDILRVHVDMATVRHPGLERHIDSVLDRNRSRFDR
jgi:hypothetical protein